jgi:hypothetical protein
MSHNAVQQYRPPKGMIRCLEFVACSLPFGLFLSAGY